MRRKTHSFIYIPLSVVIGLFLAYSISAYADNPPSPFTPADNIQDPTCLPSDSNCYVYTPNASWGTLTGTLTDQTDLSNLLDDKQAALVSGTNIKTINGTSLLGSGDISIVSSPISVNAYGTLYSEATGAGQGSEYSNANNVILGKNAGVGATYAEGSVFLGESAGQNVSSISWSLPSVMIGRYAGSNGVSTPGSVFLGTEAGQSATNAGRAQFIGTSAGAGATNASASNFFGYYAGFLAVNAQYSTFIGRYSGSYASNASQSILIGERVGNNAGSYFDALGAGIGSNNIIIGTNISLPDSTANAINIGGVLFGTGTNADVGTFNPFTPPIKTTMSAGKIGIGVLPASLTATLNTTGTTSQAPFRIVSTTAPTSPNNGDLWIASDHLYTRLGGVSYQLDGGGISLQHNYSPNSSQTVLNLIAGAGITLTEYGFGNLEISNSSIAVSSTTDGLYSSGVGTIDPNTAGVISLGFASTGNYSTMGQNSIYMGYFVWNGAASFSGESDVYIGERAGTVLDGGMVFSGGGNVVIGRNAGSDSDINAGLLGGLNYSTDSIFIGNGAGSYAGGTASIAIGKDTHNDGTTNSIALGQGATNTASNQMMIGSSSYPINDLVINGSGFTTCTVNTGTGAGISCSSDERLKTNIEDLSSVLDTLSQVRTITYNWNIAPEGTKNIGFLAQDLQQHFPQLVSTDHNGYLSVNYAGMTPILTKAIQEINLKVAPLPTFEDATLAVRISDFLKGIAEGIARIGRVETDTVQTGTLCIGSTCLTESQIKDILNAAGTQSSPVTPESEEIPSDVDVDVETPSQPESTSEPEEVPSDVDVDVETPSEEFEEIEQAPSGSTDGAVLETTIEDQPPV
ncbi:tail fiber domain-containing protein [Candidatus Nomurabacteria bacterium]|nr:tail fiber domain-containing protein [Candidatus Nomurabacteria bacterium]